MKKKFGGFTEKQMEAIAQQRLGYKGEMSKFNDYLASSPDQAAKFFKLTEKARGMVETEEPEGYATGGKVVKKTTTTAYPQAASLTNTAIKTPENLITPVKTDNIDVNKNQFIDPNVAKLPKDPIATVANPGAAQQAANPNATTAHTVDTATTGDKVEDVLDQNQTVQGTVSSGSQVEAATALPSADATVQGQLEKLMSGFDENNIPPWAAGAKRAADAMMAARGLGSSSIAASASTQTLMESALSIAVADASTFSQFEMANLNNRQQARLVNAQAFLQMDLANLDVAAQQEMFKSQARIQSLFTDQAAENASKQFNANSENQTEQFFASLKSQVQQFNAAQGNAMKMFTAEQKNAVEMFNKEMINQRDQFEATNRLIIDQSNAKWRQTVATQDNANENEANRINAQQATGLTTAAMNNIWQRERDIMAFAFTSAENAAERSHQVVLQKLGGDQAADFAQGQATGALASELIRGVGGFIGGLFQ
jgi:hypothetical protein